VANTDLAEAEMGKLCASTLYARQISVLMAIGPSSARPQATHWISCVMAGTLGCGEQLRAGDLALERRDIASD
jgi:hypothetical protein